MEPIEIVLCMGSSCYIRGNNDTVRIIQQYLQEAHLEDKVSFRGELCTCNCKNGPNLRIGNERFGKVDSASVITILKAYFLQ
jgi:NADH:ubiquinone oxidoreductase subunit E